MLKKVFEEYTTQILFTQENQSIAEPLVQLMFG